MFAIQLKSRIPAAAVVLSLIASSFAMAPLAAAQSSFTPGARAETTVDPSIHLERAETFTSDGRFDDAIAEYELAAGAYRVAGELPTSALRSLAELHRARNNYRQAARTLSALANEAREKGDTLVETSALLEASALYGDAGMAGQARQAMRRLEQLQALTIAPVGQTG